jgi:hypothetical protein
LPSLEYFIVAEDTAVDQPTNRLSVFNTIEGIKAPGFPLLIAKCSVIALWKKETDDEGRDFQTVLRVTPPAGPPYQVETNFRMNNSRHRIINRIQGLAILAPGEIRFELSLNGQPIASRIVAVEAATPQAADPTH